MRRAWRSAQRLQAELDVLHVRKPGSKPNDEQLEQLDALRRLASVLGAHLLVEEGDDVAAVTGRVAAERGTTYVMIGEPGRCAACAASANRCRSGSYETPGRRLRIVSDRARLPERAE